MSLRAVLNLGVQGMLAANSGAALTSNNVTNMTTEGYTRRTQQQSSQAGYEGVTVGGFNRYADRFTDRRLVNAHSSLEEATARAEALAVLDEALSEESGLLGDAIDEFENAIAALSADPSDPTARQEILNRAEDLASRMNATAGSLSQARTDINERIIGEVGELNATLEEISDLSREILRLENAGQDAGDLRDSRDVLVRDVADKVPVKVIEKEDSYQLMMGGSVQLTNTDSGFHPLQTSFDVTSGDVLITRNMSGIDQDVGHLITSGELGGLLAARDGALTDAQNDLDQLAVDIATAYNTVHTAGFGADGATGRNLFEPLLTTTDAAANFALSADVAGNTDAIAAGLDPTLLPGDNRNALALQALASSNIAGGSSQTASEALGSIQGAAGSAIRSAMGDMEVASDLKDQVQALRDSVSGVNADEEMLALMQYQRAFQASVLIVQKAEEMLNQMVNLGG